MLLCVVVTDGAVNKPRRGIVHYEDAAACIRVVPADDAILNG
jgi:hypothetical protein